MKQTIYTVTEDSPSHHIAEKLIKAYRPDYEAYSLKHTGGRTTILNKLPSYKKSANKLRFFILLDLDQAPCASHLINKIMGHKETWKKNLLLRIAVREIESWILADARNFCNWFGVPLNKINNQPDQLLDPKQFLINTVRKYCPNKTQKENTVPHTSSGALVGPAYNSVITEFVCQSWSAREARKHSPSLNRAILALKKIK